MEKLISLAQVEQIIEGMRTEIKLDEEFKWANWFLDARWSTACAYLIELKSKLSSLPTEESGWIATDSWEFPQRLDPELVQCMSEYWPFLWVYEWDWVFVQQYTANRVKPSHWRKITPP